MSEGTRIMPEIIVGGIREKNTPSEKTPRRE